MCYFELNDFCGNSSNLRHFSRYASLFSKEDLSLSKTFSRLSFKLNRHVVLFCFSVFDQNLETLESCVLSILFEWFNIILVINLEKFWVYSNNVSYDVEAVGQIIFWSQSSHGLILKGFFRLLWIRIRFAWVLTQELT